MAAFASRSVFSVRYLPVFRRALFPPYIRTNIRKSTAFEYEWPRVAQSNNFIIATITRATDIRFDPPNESDHHSSSLSHIHNAGEKKPGDLHCDELTLHVCITKSN